MSNAIEVGAKEAARILAVNPYTLTAWRKKGVGPPWRQEDHPERQSARTNPIKYNVHDLETYLRGDLYREDPHEPPDLSFDESSPLDLEGLDVGDEVTAPIGQRTVTLTKMRRRGRPWLDPETNTTLTNARAAQLGFRAA